jgi:hypothetical protein
MVEQIIGDEWAEEVLFQNESAELINNMIGKWMDEDPDDCYIRECLHISVAILLGRLQLDSEQKQLVRLHFSGCHYTCPETGIVTDECGRTVITEEK